MTVEIIVQRISDERDIPTEMEIKRVLGKALLKRRTNAELTIRIVDEIEARTLNQRWRGIDKATNVLSFPLAGVAEVKPNLLGDIVICAPLVSHEAGEQNKRLAAHWAHLLVHGCLHLLGFDHEHDSAAREMEQAESTILQELNYPNPYAR